MEDKLIKTIENRLNNYNFTKQSIDLLPKILENSIQELNIIDTALNCLNEHDRKIIEVLCIEGKNPKECEKLFNKTWRGLYIDKKVALSKIFKAIYGIELFLKGEN